MRIAVLGATGATGRQLVQQALDRGHTVVALARNPRDLPTRVTAVAVDVHDPDAVVAALAGADAVVSGLGVATGGPADTLVAGARALALARDRDPDLTVVWIGAYGSGPSAKAAGPLIRGLLAMGMRAELPGKVEADAIILGLGGTVFHAALLNNGPLRPARRTVGLAGAPRGPMPRFVSRATVAAAMLDEAERPTHAGQIAVALS